jgi:hypothetical protein
VSTCPVSGSTGSWISPADVEAVVVDPYRAALIQGDPRQPLAVARHEVEPGLDVLDELVVGGGRALEDQHRGDVQRGRLVLEMQTRLCLFVTSAGTVSYRARALGSLVQ